MNSLSKFETSSLPEIEGLKGGAIYKKKGRQINQTALTLLERTHFTHNGNQTRSISRVENIS